MKQRTVESAKSFIAGAFGPMNLTLKRDDIVSRVRRYIHGLRNCNMSWLVMLQCTKCTFWTCICNFRIALKRDWTDQGSTKNETNSENFHPWGQLYKIYRSEQDLTYLSATCSLCTRCADLKLLIEMCQDGVEYLIKKTSRSNQISST